MPRASPSFTHAGGKARATATSQLSGLMTTRWINKKVRGPYLSRKRSQRALLNRRNENLNLDTLVRTGQPPWRPAPAAEDLDVWDKYDFPICGTFRLRGVLVIFTIITSVGTRSLWAYVDVPKEKEQSVLSARFETADEFDTFLRGCFTGREAVFAAAENLAIRSKSDGIFISRGKNALLAAGARWYAERAAAIAGLQKPVVAIKEIREAADEATLLRVAQDVLADIPT